MTEAEPIHEQQAEQPDQHLVAGRYKLLGRIGSGRLGDIYEAEDDQYRDLAVERRVAIQLLPERVALNRQLFNKLKLGFTVLRAAPHPNIVPILDFDHDGRVGCLVTELLDGVSMRGILDSVTTLPLDEVIPVIRSVGDALQFLHAKSIVHGRLTAENVFVGADLNVCLLDIVPLNSDKSMPGSVASGDPFSRHDVAGDIYALACLTYEMLAGKHPFNFHAMAEARRAGLRPARIDALPERQWNALCRALTLDDEQQTPSLAGFVREFGVEGTERLRPSEQVRTNDQSPTGYAVPATSYPPAPPNNNSAATSASPPVARRENALDVAGVKRKRARWVRATILATILIGLTAWNFYGQPGEDIAPLVDIVDTFLDDGELESEAGDIAVAASAETTPTDSPPLAELQSESEIDSPAMPPGASQVAETSTGDETVVDLIDATAPQPAVEQAEMPDTVAPQSNDEIVIEEPAVTSGAASPTQSEAEFAMLQAVVSVSEHGGAAQIANPLPDNTMGQVFWWTADHSAIGESDYIPAAEPRQGFASGDAAEMLHIPLVNDSIPEPGETFYVYLGRHNPRLGRLETIARIEVEIIDDDL